MRTTKIVIGLIAIGFLAGLLAGYEVWRPRDGANADLRQLLARAADAADRVVRKNEELLSQVESLKGNARDAEALKSENQALKNRLDNAATQAGERLSGLDNQVRDLRGRLERQQQEIAAKESRNARLKEELSAARQESQQLVDLKARNDELQSRISALEAENGRLRSVIDNVSALTREKQPAQ